MKSAAQRVIDNPSSYRLITDPALGAIYEMIPASPDYDRNFWVRKDLVDQEAKRPRSLPVSIKKIKGDHCVIGSLSDLSTVMKVMRRA